MTCIIGENEKKIDSMLKKKEHQWSIGDVKAIPG